MAFPGDPLPKFTLGIMAQNILTVKVNDGESWILIDRLVWDDGTPFDRDTTGAYGVVDVSIAVYDEDGSALATAIYTGTIAVASILFDQPYQVDGYLPLMPDSIGYNMRYTLPYTFANVEGGHIYRVELKFNPHASNTFGQKMWARRFDVQGMVST